MPRSFNSERPMGNLTQPGATSRRKPVKQKPKEVVVNTLEALSSPPSVLVLQQQSADVSTYTRLMWIEATEVNKGYTSSTAERNVTKLTVTHSTCANDNAACAKQGYESWSERGRDFWPINSTGPQFSDAAIRPISVGVFSETKICIFKVGTIFFFQCFEAVSWVRGRVFGLFKMLSHMFSFGATEWFVSNYPIWPDQNRWTLFRLHYK